MNDMDQIGFPEEYDVTVAVGTNRTASSTSNASLLSVPIDSADAPTNAAADDVGLQQTEVVRWSHLIPIKSAASKTASNPSTKSTNAGISDAKMYSWVRNLRAGRGNHQREQVEEGSIATETEVGMQRKHSTAGHSEVLKVNSVPSANATSNTAAGSHGSPVPDVRIGLQQPPAAVTGQHIPMEYSLSDVSHQTRKPCASKSSISSMMSMIFSKPSNKTISSKTSNGPLAPQVEFLADSTESIEGGENPDAALSNIREVDLRDDARDDDCETAETPECESNMHAEGGGVFATSPGNAGSKKSNKKKAFCFVLLAGLVSTAIGLAIGLELDTEFSVSNYLQDAFAPAPTPDPKPAPKSDSPYSPPGPESTELLPESSP